MRCPYYHQENQHCSLVGGACINSREAFRNDYPNCYEIKDRKQWGSLKEYADGVGKLSLSKD